MRDIHDKPSYNLRRTLWKLGVITAEVNPFEEALASTYRSMRSEVYGTPDTLIMSPSAIDSFMKTFGDKK